MAITRDDVLHVAALARLEIPEGEVDAVIRRLTHCAIDAAQIAARCELEEDHLGRRRREELFSRLRRLAPFHLTEADVMLVRATDVSIAHGFRDVGIDAQIERLVEGMDGHGSPNSSSPTGISREPGAGRARERYA